MVFSFFKKPPKTMTAKPAVVPAARATEEQDQNGSAADVAGAQDQSLEAAEFSDFSFDDSLAAFEIEETADDPIDADIEEAAILYANQQNDDARRALENSIQRHERGTGERLWRMLFDLYQVMNDRQAFDARGIEYAQCFEKSPPVWKGGAQNRPSSAPAVGGVSFSGDLLGANRPAFVSIQQALEKRNQLRVDFSRVRKADAEGCGILLNLIQEARQKQKEVELLGLDSLAAILQKQIVPGETSNQECWLLFLELCQQQGKQEVFENTAIDYAVTFELSPPSWDEKRVATRKRAPEPGDAKKQEVGEQDAKKQSEPASTDVYVLEGDIRAGRFDDLVSYAEEHDNIVIDCSRLIRIDFVSAGTLSNVLTTLRRDGKTVVMRHPNHLVAGLFRVLGLNAAAKLVFTK